MFGMVDELFKKIKQPDWKLVRSANNFNIYTAKASETSNLLRYKFEGTLPVAWRLLYDFLRVPQNVNSIWHPQDYMGELEMLTELDNFKEYREVWNLPFPLANREITVAQWDYCEPARGVIVAQNMTKELPRKKGLVRSKLRMFGFVMEQGASPSETSFTHVFSIDAMGNMPVWVQNKVSADYYLSVQRLIKHFAHKK
jgi:hypothetical protein